MGNINFELSDKFGFKSPFESEKILQNEEVVEEEETPANISLKCSLTSNIKINTVVKINFSVAGESQKGFGFDYIVDLSSSDNRLKIYDNDFKVDKGWSFITQISRDKIGSSSLDLIANKIKVNTFYFNFVNSLDAFTDQDRKIIIETNSDLIGDDIVCFRVADKALSKLLNDSSLILKNYSSVSGYDRINDFKSKGIVQKNQLFNQSTIWNRKKDGSYSFKPYSFKSGQEKCFSNFVSNTINCLGIHVYHFILLDGYHVLILLIDNTDTCKIKFKILDQIKHRDWQDFNSLDNELLKMTINNYNYACDASKRKDINSSINLCKIKSTK